LRALRERQVTSPSRCPASCTGPAEKETTGYEPLDNRLRARCSGPGERETTGYGPLDNRLRSLGQQVTSTLHRSCRERERTGYEPFDNRSRARCIGPAVRLRERGERETTGYEPFERGERETARCSGPAVRLRLRIPLSSECGTCETVKAILWPWLSCKSPQNISRCSLFARRRHVRPQPDRSCSTFFFFFVTLQPRVE